MRATQLDFLAIPTIHGCAPPTIIEAAPLKAEGAVAPFPMTMRVTHMAFMAAMVAAASLSIPSASAQQVGKKKSISRSSASLEDDEVSSVDSPAETKKLLKKASALAQKAKTQAELNEVLELCQKAKSTSLSERDTLYVRKLAGWSYNQLGELIAIEASNAAARGEESLSAELDQKGLKIFSLAIRADPNNWKAWKNRAVSRGVLGLLEDSLDDLNRTLELKQDEPKVWYNRGEIRKDLGDMAGALDDYDKAIELDPDEATYYFVRGEARENLGRNGQALADYNKAVEIAPDSPRYRVARGEYFLRQQEWGKAGNDFRESIRLDADYPAAYRGAAWVMATAPQPRYRNAKAAVEAAEKALEMAKQSGEVDYRYYDTTAAAMANAARFEVARQMLSSAIKMAPQDAQVELRERMNLYANGKPFRGAPGTVLQASNKR